MTPLSPRDYDCDCLIIGGGAGGLVAATYLARTHRRVVVADAGESRLGWIRLSHNVPGYPEGISGDALLHRLRDQADRYGVRRRETMVDGVRRRDGGGFEAGGVTARRLILATGVADILPPIDGLEAAVREAVVRLCPICDGFEATGGSIGILGPRARAEREAAFMRTFTDDLTTFGGPGSDMTPVVTAVSAVDGRIRLQLADGETRDLDALYLATGLAPRSGLASALGARLSANGYVEVDDHQRTGAGGVWAIGDVVHELNQIAIAFGHGAIAATDVHNDLAAEERGQPKER